MYLKQIADAVADRINDETLSSTGTHYTRTKEFVNEFMFLDLIPRYDWSWLKKDGTLTTANGTQRYSLPRWVDHPSKIDKIIHPTTREHLRQATRNDIQGMSITETNTPTHYTFAPRTRTEYTTGTISATSGTKVITGSGTSWSSSNVEAYDLLKVGSVVYRVKSVDSTTQLTVYEDIITTISAGSSYTLVNDAWKIDLWPTPNATIAFELKASKILPRLQNDSDIPEFPDNWHNILVKGAVVLALKHNNNDFNAELLELEADIKKMIAEERTNNDYLESIQIPRMRGITSRPHYRT